MGMDLTSNCLTMELAREYPEIILPAVGYHPWSIVPEQLDGLMDHLAAQLPACVALGEVGLRLQGSYQKTGSVRPQTAGSTNGV